MNAAFQMVVLLCLRMAFMRIQTSARAAKESDAGCFSKHDLGYTPMTKP